MSENAHTLQDLKIMQNLPLDIKVAMSKTRIRAWVDKFGVAGVYISFSGGKDSTVLLDLVRQEFPDVPAVFVDTGLEYPEIREFVKRFDNVVWLKPKMNFKKVVETYGYPMISKEVANNVAGARKYLRAKWRSGNFHIPINTEEYVELASTINQDLGKVEGSPRRLAILLGMLDKHRRATIPNTKDRSFYSMKRYSFMLDAPFEVNDQCCSVMKKQPAHQYYRETGRKPIVATLAEESLLRTQKWIEQGCNVFNAKIPMSKPLSFWTEQDVLRYIKQNHLPIASVYGDIVYQDDDGNQYSEALGDLKLATTGCDRTGCMFCGFGCHLNNDQRFVSMHKTHPKQYEWIMKPTTQGGLGYKDVIDWINEHGNLNIKY